jgi:hypothetical protein
MGDSFYHIFPPHTCFCWLYSLEGVAIHIVISKKLSWVISHWYQGLIDYLLFYVPLKNISLTWRRHYYRWRAAKFRPYAWRSGLLSWEGSLLCRTCCDTGPRFFLSHLKDCPIQLPLTTHKGCGLSILTWILMGLDININIRYDTTRNPRNILTFIYIRYHKEFFEYSAI